MMIAVAARIDPSRSRGVFVAVFDTIPSGLPPQSPSRPARIVEVAPWHAFVVNGDDGVVLNSRGPQVFPRARPAIPDTFPTIDAAGAS
jgi:hypothetical protein